MDPATDTYYYWLCTISIPVFYNLMLLVARSDITARYELFLFRWSWFIMSVCFWFPFRACFNELQYTNTTWWMVFDYISDFLYACDTFVRARTGQC